MNEVSSKEMRSVLQSAGLYTKEHFKLLKQDDRKTLLVIIQNLSNPSEGIPLTKKQVENLKTNIEKINDYKERGKIDRSTSFLKAISRTFKNIFSGRTSSSKLNKKMNNFYKAKKNTYLNEHYFNVKHSVDFEKNVKRLWKSVDAGKKPVIAKGACESRIYSYKNNRAIFKDITPKDVSTKRIIEITIKKLLGITRPTELLPGADPESKGFAEKLAYDLDQYLGLGFVPETNFINKPIGPNLEGDVGTLQLFLGPSYKEAKEIFSEPKHTPNLEERTLFQKFILFDYLIGNLDRHEENWMVQLSEEGRLTGIGAIDNGNSFIEKNPSPSDKTILKNQYKWSQHPYSIPHFTEEAKAFVNGIDEVMLIDFLNDKKEELKKHPHTKTFYSKEMVQNTVKRLRVMKNLVNQENSSPEMLGKIKTEKAIKRSLAE